MWVLWDGAEPYCPVPVDAEPDEHILEPRCYCGRLLDFGYGPVGAEIWACPVHGSAVSAESDTVRV